MATVDQKAWKGKGMEGTVARWYAVFVRDKPPDLWLTLGNDKAEIACLTLSSRNSNPHWFSPPFLIWR